VEIGCGERTTDVNIVVQEQWRHDGLIYLTTTGWRLDEAAKPSINGSALVGINLRTSPDNKNITASNLFLRGTLMQNRVENLNSLDQ